MWPGAIKADSGAVPRVREGFKLNLEGSASVLGLLKIDVLTNYCPTNDRFCVLFFFSFETSILTLYSQ